ncbi:26S proteasome regulatory subunit rpn11 [Purpureocillium lavendulum]|uniref:26S proteasome regulatory subunit rpn11 n=1 Tax=Purpureocillium lavendulum TaxID=1247861 RepID=A0AB34FUQ2_9HYPO|nr:26S proteasome regulatory subunit rpn11 [Purpureocillium lavendulum]
MVFAVSFGDAYTMGKIAFRIGQAFTKGKKSAPSEFREVESQLYSLSAALNAFSNARRDNDKAAPLIVDRTQLPANVPAHFADNQDIILGMLASCSETLTHLEGLVAKYSVITAPTDAGQPRIKRWNKELLSSWRRVQWTTEGGTLTDLKSNLTIQTNSLNLILGVVVNSQADRLQTDMDHISTMIGDIHEWYVDNLKGRAGAGTGAPGGAAGGVANAPTFGVAAAATFGTVATPGGPAAGEGQAAAPPKPLYFELHEQTGQRSKELCLKVSLSQKVSGAYYSSSLRNNQLFTCGCPKAAEDAHRSAVEAYGLSPLSFAARIAGAERSWLLYKVSNRVTDQLTSLVVKGVPPEVMHDFEELLVHGLSVLQTRQMLRRSMSTMLAHASDMDADNPKANILDLVRQVSSQSSCTSTKGRTAADNAQSNATTLHKSISSVKFSSGTVHYPRDNIDFVQILHYKSIELSRILDEAILPQSAFEENRRAEIIITYGKPDPAAKTTPVDNTVRTIVQIFSHSEVQHKGGEDVVFIKNVECTGYDASDTPRPPATATVTLEFASADAAAGWYKELDAIRMDLFVIDLQYPREDERVLVKLQAQDVHTERMHITDADIMILQNSQTERFRLVVRSKTGYSVLSQELNTDFFQTLATRNSPDYSALSFEVYMNAAGKRVVKQCPRGFSHLFFSDNKIEQVFTMGLAAVGGPVTQQHQIEGPTTPTPMEGVVQG